jgi:ribosomal-protein-serine acetyltransferase
LTGNLLTCNILVIVDKIIPSRKTTRLTDGKILLRPYEKKDINDLHQATLASLKELILWMPWAHENYTLSESKGFIKRGFESWRNGSQYNFAICDAATGKQVGVCGLNDFSEMNSRANLGYWVRTNRTGQGIAPAATKLLAKWGFETLGLKRIEIVVAVENARSLRVAEKAGAKREGILRNRLLLGGKPHDAVMHSLVSGEI